ncbi:hypothetical protein [Micromonospora sp. WMMD980]|uniref:hypothetical protein n=1 Tax=Micromonospora sp. WMMD980 TaxID=3016088 RepID=UPI0024161F9E|nr:hypothetical protein [Micromonospora sp. WMMD980]MDG4798955.1 hypothetical protein [Micromonospora sp. WMMD980]MDG4798972.1 hypothetical protein [Micromonospora sp. WMMD980]MDG4799021.1 hypothetical protein [Micromonospora sp. WMMD980]
MSTTYTGRHRRGAVVPAPADYNPLAPADRQALAPHHWADRALPAGPDERTGRIDPTVVQALRQPTPVDQDRTQILADIRAGANTPPEVLASLNAWKAAGCPMTDETGDQQ